MKLFKGDFSVLLLILIIILVIVGVIVSVLSFRSNPVEDAISDERVINVLYVIEDDKKPVSTYVLMYYPVRKRAAVFDIPGDLGLLISRINRVDRIDRVYDPARIGNYQSEIEKLLGIEINFSVVITKENLVSIVDLLEGVEIFIPSPVFYHDEDEIIIFPSGITNLDGDKASLYAVYSLPHEDSSMTAFRRQRFFLGFLDRQIQMNESLNNQYTAKLYYSFFRTSMNQRTLMQLFNEFVNIDTNRINIQSISGDLREVSGQMLVIPHYAGNLIKEIVRQTVGTLTSNIEDLLIERTVTVEVLNGTATNGLAGRTAELLRGFGYDVITIGNADKNTYDATEIVYRTGDENLVRIFADIIRCTNIRRETSLLEQIDGSFAAADPLNLAVEYKADITLLIGRDFNGRYVSGN
ncbi:MAG: LCP family protein [Treponema sp.]|nr:LCP family protein [Treponema sp.]